MASGQKSVVCPVSITVAAGVSSQIFRKYVMDRFLIEKQLVEQSNYGKCRAVTQVGFKE